MPKMTLLEIVQDILSDIDSDEVNSISSTVEATQVANIVKSTYFNIIDGRDWPHLYELFQLTSSGTTARPTHMAIPEGITEVSWVKYNCVEYGQTKDAFRKLIYLTPEKFMEMSDLRNSTDAAINTVIDTTGVKIHIYNERAPTYYTSLDNDFIILDAYDVAVDSTSQTSKTQCYGKRYPVWSAVDTFIPDLPVQAFSYLLNEAKSTTFLRFKQMPDQKAEQNSVTQRRRMSQQAWKVQKGISYPNYGRKK